MLLGMMMVLVLVIVVMALLGRPIHWLGMELLPLMLGWPVFQVDVRGAVLHDGNSILRRRWRWRNIWRWRRIPGHWAIGYSVDWWRQI